MSRVLPSPRQIEYQSWQLGLFLHFGLRTFYEGFRDFDDRKMSPEQFNPAELDCHSWAATARKAGFNYVVMTAKHHDGFALWPSKTTGFSVAGSPWRGGVGDVVREFLDACRAHGLKSGLYYSPYDADSPVYEDEKAYDDFFITQISELLVPYGEIDILWFDGCGSQDHAYDWPRIVGDIRRMQPNILIFNLGDPDFRWIGNEDGYAPAGTSSVVDDRWLPAECDSRMRDRNWFFSDRDAHTVKSVEELVGMYYYSCGRNSNMLINIGPDRRGLLPDADAARLVAFGEEIARRFASPVATLADCAQEGDTWEYRADAYVLADHVVIGEDIALGEAIRRFAITATTWCSQKPITVYEGRTVGYKTICRFPPIRARKLRLEVLEADGEVRLRTLDFHCAGG